MNSGLWDDIEYYATYWSRAKNGDLKPAMHSNHISDIKRAIQEEIPSNRFEPEHLTEEQAATLNVGLDVSSPTRDSKNQEHDRIQDIKYRYIVGRYAGRDLFDANQERVIIRKGEQISLKIIQEAEASGKLIELIMNMVIDQFGKP